LKLIVQLAQDRSAGGRGRRPAHARDTVIGQSKFSVPAGRSKVVKVKLSHLGMLLVQRSGGQGLRASVGGTGVRTRTVILMWREVRKTRRSAH
jgi:hypothetical protein